MNTAQVNAIITDFITQHCKTLPAVCKKYNSGPAGFEYVKNRVLHMVEHDLLQPDEALGQLEIELNEA